MEEHSAELAVSVVELALSAEADLAEAQSAAEEDSAEAASAEAASVAVDLGEAESVEAVDSVVVEDSGEADLAEAEADSAVEAEGTAAGADLTYARMRRHAAGTASKLQQSRRAHDLLGFVRRLSR